MAPSRLLSNDKVLVDQPLPLREFIAGLATVELPGHTRQLHEDAPTPKQHEGCRRTCEN